MRDVFIDRLLQIAHHDKWIFLITGDLGFGVLDKFIEQLPRQFLNVGVAEQNMTGIATGLALEGRIVFTYSLGNFPSLRCLEQIRNDACYHEANVKIVTVGGGLSYGALGMSHHAIEDIAVMRAMPGITVVAPGCDWEAAESARCAVETPGVCYLRLDKTTAGNTARQDEKFSYGKARVLMEGGDITILSTGGILKCTMEAAERLSGDGLGVLLISVPFVKPLDKVVINQAARSTRALLTVEEHSIIGGLGGAVAEYCLENGCSPPRFKRLGLQDVFPTIVGSQSYLRDYYGLGVQAIVEGAKELLL